MQPFRNATVTCGVTVKKGICLIWVPVDTVPRPHIQRKHMKKNSLTWKPFFPLVSCMLCAVLEKILISPETWVFAILLFHAPIPFGLPKDIPAELFRPSSVPAPAGMGELLTFLGSS